MLVVTIGYYNGVSSMWLPLADRYTNNSCQILYFLSNSCQILLLLSLSCHIFLFLTHSCHIILYLSHSCHIILYLSHSCHILYILPHGCHNIYILYFIAVIRVGNLLYLSFTLRSFFLFAFFKEQQEKSKVK